MPGGEDKIKRILSLVDEYHKHKKNNRLYIKSEACMMLLAELKLLEFETGYTPNNSPTRDLS